MKLVLQTKLHMAGGCFKVAYDPEFRPVWENQTPLAFGLEIERLRALYDELNARSAKVKVTGPGAREAKLAVENELCGLAHVMAQAVAFHAKKAGQVERAAQADLSRSDVQRGSMQQRVDIAAAVLDLASSVVDQPGASD